MISLKLVSIIVPVYNRAKKIKDCYRSLINQTYENIEIVFVDDGSVDNTLEVLNSLSDKRVRICSQENSGPSEARRHGLKIAKGDYICFVDSDDKIAKSFVKKMVTTIEKYNTDMAISAIKYHFSNPAFVRALMVKSKNRPKMIDLSKRPEYLPALMPFVWGKIFKRESLELKKVDFRANEDLTIMYPMYAKVNKIAVNNSAIYHNYYSKVSQKILLFGYKFENMYNTFGPLHMVYQEFENMNLLDKYHDALEMLFIKNLFERINNLAECIDSKVFLYKFVSVLLDYLEYFFPNWANNPYYISGFMLGEVLELIRIDRASYIISKIKRKKVNIALEDIYHKYRAVEEEYIEYKKNKDYISRI